MVCSEAGKGHITPKASSLNLIINRAEQAGFGKYNKGEGESRVDLDNASHDFATLI
jgi:hypothetical protein